MVHLMIRWCPSSLGAEDTSIATPDTCSTGCWLYGSVLAVDLGGIGVGVDCHAVVTSATVLGFDGEAGTKAMGFCSHVVSVRVVVMVIGCWSAASSVVFGLGVVVCCLLVLMALLVLDRSFPSVLKKVCAAAMVRFRGAGCREAGLVGETVLPLALESSLLAVVSSSMASIT